MKNIDLSRLNYKNSNYYIISGILLLVIFSYFDLKETFPFYWNIDKELHLIVGQFLLNSGKIPAYIDYPTFGFYFINYLITKILYFIDFISFSNLDQLKLAQDPFILISEYMQSLKQVMPFLSLLIIINIVISIFILLSSRPYAIMSALLLISMDSLLYNSTLISVEIYAALCISFSILFTALFVKFYMNRFSEVLIIISGFFWGLAFLNNLYCHYLIIPLLIMLYFIQNNYFSAESLLIKTSKKFEFLFYLVFFLIFITIITAKYFKIIPLIYLKNPVWTINYAFFFLFVIFIINNKIIAQNIAKYSNDFRFRKAILLSILGLIVSSVMHFFTPISFDESIAYFFNDLRISFFLQQSLSWKIFVQNFTNLPQYVLPIAILSFAGIVHARKMQNRQILLGPILLVITMILVFSYQPIYAHRYKYFLAYFLLNIVIVISGSRLWFYSINSKNLITLILIVLTGLNLLNIIDLKSGLLLAEGKDKKKIESILTKDFVGNEISFLLVLENSYDRLNINMQSSLQCIFNHLSGINQFKKDLKTIINRDLNLVNASMLNNYRIIKEQDSNMIVEDIPSYLQNTIIFDLAKTTKRETGKKNKMPINPVADSNINSILRVTPRFDRETYLLSINKIENSENVYDTKNKITMQNAEITKNYYVYKLLNSLEMPQISKSSEYFLVVKKF